MLSPLPMCFEWLCVTVCAVRATISLHLIVGFVHIVAIVLQCWHLLQKSDNYSNVHIANNNTHQHILKLLSNAFVFLKKNVLKQSNLSIYRLFFSVLVPLFEMFGMFEMWGAVYLYQALLHLVQFLVLLHFYLLLNFLYNVILH